MFVGSAFQFGFLPSKPYCSQKYTFELMLHRGNPTVNRFFAAPMDQRHILATYIDRLFKPKSGICMRTFFFFQDPFSDRNNAKYGLKYAFKNQIGPKPFKFSICRYKKSSRTILLVPCFDFRAMTKKNYRKRISSRTCYYLGYRYFRSLLDCNSFWRYSRGNVTFVALL